jgi:hypothetical protein
VSVENIQRSLVTSPRKFSIYWKIFKFKFKKYDLRNFSISLYFQLVHKLSTKEFLVSGDFPWHNVLSCTKFNKLRSFRFAGKNVGKHLNNCLANSFYFYWICCIISGCQNLTE